MTDAREEPVPELTITKHHPSLPMLKYLDKGQITVGTLSMTLQKGVTRRKTLSHIIPGKLKKCDDIVSIYGLSYLLPQLIQKETE